MIETYSVDNDKVDQFGCHFVLTEDCVSLGMVIALVTEPDKDFAIVVGDGFFGNDYIGSTCDPRPEENHCVCNGENSTLPQEEPLTSHIDSGVQECYP